MSTELEQVKKLFLEVMEISPDQRDSFLEKNCQGNPRLRQSVEQLLRGHSDGVSLIDRVVDDDQSGVKTSHRSFQEMSSVPTNCWKPSAKAGWARSYCRTQGWRVFDSRCDIGGIGVSDNFEIKIHRIPVPATILTDLLNVDMPNSRTLHPAQSKNGLHGTSSRKSEFDCFYFCRCELAS